MSTDARDADAKGGGPMTTQSHARPPRVASSGADAHPDATRPEPERSTGGATLTTSEASYFEGQEAELERFRRYLAAPTQAERHALIESNIGLAVHLAGQFTRPGVGHDDLRQTAMVGLVKAVDRFDPHHGAPFAPFARRVIEGEVKRYLRDRTWSVRVPRTAQDLHRLVRSTTERLHQQLSRSPTVDELVEALDVSREDVLRGLAAGAAFTTTSLPEQGAEYEALVIDDRGFDELFDAMELGDLLDRLNDRERRIVELRFVHEYTQSEIAEVVGLSQMHVSRLLRKALERLRQLRLLDRAA